MTKRLKYAIVVSSNTVFIEQTESSLLFTGFGRFATSRLVIYLFLYTMQQGKIARLTDKGFGFISREGEQKDLFFHSNNLVDVSYNDLREGDTVTFDIEEGPKGLNAINVKRV